MADIETLPQDIYNLFSPHVDHLASEENLETFCTNLKQTLRQRLAKQESREGNLRFSSLGWPDRKLWLASRGVQGEEMDGKLLFKFLYGHIIEELILFLAKEAGHSVSNEQEEVEVLGVKGHIDAIVDGVVVDVKSASPFGYKKFKDGTVIEDDPFGYIQQISGYSNVLTPTQGPAFIAFDKVAGDICVSPVSISVASCHKPEDRISHLKQALASDVIPPVCYPPVPDGKSGNMKLATGCSYCAYKKECWPQARLFLYSTGPRWLTTVAREPDVHEVKEKDIVLSEDM